jgi:hypothetical protein
MTKSISGWEFASYGIGFGLLACGAAIVLWATYVGPRQDREARAAAETFCSSLLVGEDVRPLAQKANQAGTQLLTWPAEYGSTRHQAWFSGFLANGFVCEVRERDGKIASKYTEEHTW